MKNNTGTESWNILKSELDSVIKTYVPMKKQGKLSKGKDKDYEAYKEALNAATNEVTKSRQNFEHKLAQNIKSDSKSFYVYVRSKQNVQDKVGPLEAFSISSGVRQGCVLAANLFNTATDRILNNTTQVLTLGVNYDDSGQLITDLDCADDIVIFADLLDTLEDALFIFNEQSQKLGLHVNWSKTKLQSFSPWIPTPPSTLIGTQPVTTTDNFTYLGSTIANNNSSFNDVSRRIAIATSTMSNLSSLWTSSRLSLALKMRLCNSLIISIITYSSASWTLTKAKKKRLDAFNTKALRRIVGVRWHDYVTNASIVICTGQSPLTTKICKLSISAFGHICCLQPGTQAIDILASTLPSSWCRSRGRPPFRWADQIVKDTQMSLSDAVTETHDRTSWRSLVRDATRPATQAT